MSKSKSKSKNNTAFAGTLSQLPKHPDATCGIHDNKSEQMVRSCFAFPEQHHLKISENNEVLGNLVTAAIKSRNWICYQHRLYRYDDQWGFFRCLYNEDDENSAILMLFPAEEQTSIPLSVLSHVRKHLKIASQIAIPEMNLQGDRYVNCKNGVIDLQTLELLPHDRSHLFNYVNYANFVEYLDEEGKFSTPVMDTYVETSLESCLNKNMLLYEMIGYMCSSVQSAKKALFVIGPPDCGKSVLIRVIHMLLGEDQVSAIRLQNLGAHFSNAKLSTVRANIHPELSSAPIKNVDAFKIIVGSDKDEGEDKGGAHFTFRHTEKLMFGGNYMPLLKMPEPSDAFINRIALLKLNKSIPKAEQDPKLEEKLEREMDGIFTISILALIHLKKNNYVFTCDDDAAAVMRQYKDEINNVEAFVKQCCITGKESRCYTSHLYDAYARWCTLNADKAFDKKQFSINLAAVLNTTSTTVRVNGGKPLKGFKGISLR